MTDLSRTDNELLTAIVRGDHPALLALYDRHRQVAYGLAYRILGEAEAGSEVTGVYVARPTFTAPGPWSVVARLTLPDGTRRAGHADFTVEADPPVPGPGDPAIASKTLVATTPEDAAKIYTADPVDDMHDLSLYEAVKNGKPTIVLFATPALCTSRVCGSSLETTQDLKRRYGDRANFIHVEL